jgi:hypothetical protein
MKRLRRLVALANMLFRRQQKISLVDLLYAALWRQMSAMEAGDLPMALTVIEKTANPEQGFDRATADSVPRVFFVSDGYLTSQSLVGMAQRIRCSLAERSNNTRSEEWLVDNLEPMGASFIDPADSGGLICSTLALPYLQRLIYKRPPQPSGSAGSSVNSDSHARADFNFAPGLSSAATVAEKVDLPHRIACINTGYKTLSGGSDFDMSAERNARGRSAGSPLRAISIDMWLPVAEIDRFKLQYGDLCFVDDSFFDN